eukprot:3651420-Lingulodinium_polyedra.AAC.1
MSSAIASFGVCGSVGDAYQRAMVAPVPGYSVSQTILEIRDETTRVSVAFSSASVSWVFNVCRPPKSSQGPEA